MRNTVIFRSTGLQLIVEIVVYLGVIFALLFLLYLVKPYGGTTKPETSQVTAPISTATPCDCSCKPTLANEVSRTATTP